MSNKHIGLNHIHPQKSRIISFDLLDYLHTVAQIFMSFFTDKKNCEFT